MACTLGATVALATLPGCGETPSTATAPASVPEAERARTARMAQGLVSITPQDLGYRLVLDGADTTLKAQTDTRARTITLFLRRDDVPHVVAHDLAHELGHAFDERHMTDTDRQAYLARRGALDAEWWPGDRVSDLESGSGDFAEVFALCAAASPEYRSLLAPRPETPCDELPADARRSLTR